MRIIYTIAFASLLLFSSCTSKLYKDKLALTKQDYKKVFDYFFEDMLPMYMYDKSGCIEKDVIFRDSDFLSYIKPHRLTINKKYLQLEANDNILSNPFDIKGGEFSLPKSVPKSYKKIHLEKDIFTYRGCDVILFVSPPIKTNQKNKFIIQALYIETLNEGPKSKYVGTNGFFFEFTQNEQGKIVTYTFYEAFSNSSVVPY